MRIENNSPTSLCIKVIPRARKTELIGTMDDGALKVRVAAVPDDGKANTELCRYLWELYGGDWEVIAWNTGTRKVVKRVTILGNL